MRSGIRLRLVLFGLFAVLAGGYAAFLTIVSFDWWLGFPGVLRVIVTGIFLGGFGGAAYYWIVKPLRAPLSVEAIAGRLERHFDYLRDRLTSTVSFQAGSTDGSPDMIRKFVENTERIVADVPLESALTVKPLLRSVAGFLIASAVMASVVVYQPEWVSIGWKRYTEPFGSARWPTRVEVAPLTFDTIVPMGESATVMMRVVRGYQATLRGMVFVRDSDGQVSVMTMQPGHNGLYEATIDTITGDLTCWFAAGDHSTRELPFTIRAVKRPVTLEAVASVSPPHYASDRPTIHQNFGDGAVTAPIGGTVEVQVRVSKPVRSGAGEESSGLLLADGRRLPLRQHLEDPSMLSASMPVAGDIRFRIQLWDHDGLENRGAMERVIVARPDRKPVLVMERPTALTEITPGGIVPLKVRVEDDFGIESVAIEGNLPGDQPIAPISLDEHLVRRETEEAVGADVTHDWSMASLGLVPGDLLSFHVTATDNRRLDDLLPQEGRSALMRIKIISDVEFEMRIRDDVAMLERHLRAALLEQQTVIEQTEDYRASLQEVTTMDFSQRESAALIGGRQTKLGKHIRELAGRFASIAERLGQSKTASEQVRTEVGVLGEALEEIAEIPMKSASGRLRDVYEERELARSLSALDEAYDLQLDAADQLRALVRSMAQWGNFRTLVTKTRDMLQRQAAIRTQTQITGKSTLGKPVESLSADEKKRLNQLRRQQDQLVEELGQLLEGMQRMATAEIEKNPSSAAASEDALRVAKAHNVQRHGQDATEAINDNRTAAATVAQKKIERALSKTLATLEQRDTRELLRLRKEARQAQELIAQIIEDQRQLQTATVEAGLMNLDDAVFAEQADQQRQIRGNTKAVASDLAAMEKMEEVARILRLVDKPMDQAAAALEQSDAEPASGAQTDAIGMLEEALRALEVIEREAENEVVRRTIQQIQKELAATAAAQHELNDKLALLVDRIAERGRVGRPEAREATKLSRQQSEIHVLLLDVMPELENVKVYKWALERADQWMREIRDNLARRAVDQDVHDKGVRVERRLSQLVSAIAQTLALPESHEFKEADEGGGGGGGGTERSKAVPPVAELLVLKSLQIDINERTVALNQTLSEGQATESQLKSLAELGQDQAEVMRLAKQVTGRARGE
jgi:hypothetical protein